MVMGGSIWSFTWHSVIGEADSVVLFVHTIVVGCGDSDCPTQLEADISANGGIIAIGSGV